MSYLTISNWNDFTARPGNRRGEMCFVSPVLRTPSPWTELVPTWNIRAATNAGFQFEFRPVYGDRPSDFFHLGHWTAHPDATRPRHSVNGQSNEIGRVLTDTLVVADPCRYLEIRITVFDPGRTHAHPPVEYLGLDLFDASRPISLNAAFDAARPTEIAVPQRSQLAHPNGRDWCSPTSVSMVLAYWAAILRRPELNLDLADVAAGVNDPDWPGTGNWAFNAAFAGKFPGMRARVTRLPDVRALQRWLRAGIPVAVSVSFNLLNGRLNDDGTGHLIVCVGTTGDGQFLVNDPFADLTRGESVRRVVSRDTLARAWGRSRGVVYLIYPETWATP